MKFTGERFHPEIKEFWSIEHLHRYVCIQELCSNKIVLDVACGEGYGSAILSQKAKSVFGVDISEVAINHASNNYKFKNLKFIKGNAIKLDFENNYFDLVVSYETLEHFDNHEDFLIEIKRVLKKDGILIISTPDKLNYTDMQGYHNPYHVKELYKDEFTNLINNHFNYLHLFSQNFILGSLILSRSLCCISKEYLEKNGTIESEPIDSHPIYLIAIASDEEKTSIQLQSFFSYKNYIEIKALDSNSIKFETIEYKIGKTILMPFKLIKLVIRWMKRQS
jgi:ubiquinone/menaquinone biosynthesis C-methylase UbiE